jgi:hypothetical protein
MPARLHDLGDGQALRVVGLQMRGHDSHALLEQLERHAGLDANTLDPAANRDAMIAIQRA